MNDRMVEFNLESTLCIKSQNYLAMKQVDSKSRQHHRACSSRPDDHSSEHKVIRIRGGGGVDY